MRAPAITRREATHKRTSIVMCRYSELMKTDKRGIFLTYIIIFSMPNGFDI